MLATDQVDWALDEDGDLIMPIRYTRGLDAVAQGIRIRLRLVRGEWFLNMDAGVPYLDSNGVDPTLVLFGAKFDAVRADAAFRAAILKTPGVRSVLALSLVFDGRTRSLQASFQVATEFGDTSVETVTVPL